MNLSSFRTISISLALLLFYGSSHQALMKRQQLFTSSVQGSSLSRGLWDLPPVILQALSGEFKGLVADYLTLEAGATLGTEVIRTPDGKKIIVNKKIDWKNVEKIFTASQILDSSFAQTYLVAQGWLSWEAGLIKEANHILETAATARPWDWRPLQLIGFNYYYFFDQPGKAGELYLKAAEIPNAPNYLAILGSRLAQKGGKTETAIVILQSMLELLQETDPGYEDISDRLQALKGTLILEKGVKEYKTKTGRFPSSPNDLLTEGILDTLPPNPYGVNYCIDKKGRVFFDPVNC